MDAFNWLRKPKPTLTNPETANPAVPLPSWQITGSPLPSPVPAQAKLWTQARANPFPSRSIVQQPARITSIA